jgi:hypothetical protein
MLAGGRFSEHSRDEVCTKIESLTESYYLHLMDSSRDDHPALMMVPREGGGGSTGGMTWTVVRTLQTPEFSHRVPTPAAAAAAAPFPATVSPTACAGPQAQEAGFGGGSRPGAQGSPQAPDELWRAAAACQKSDHEPACSLPPPPHVHHPLCLAACQTAPTHRHFGILHGCAACPVY